MFLLIWKCFDEERKSLLFCQGELREELRRLRQEHAERMEKMQGLEVSIYVYVFLLKVNWLLILLRLTLKMLS